MLSSVCKLCLFILFTHNLEQYIFCLFFVYKIKNNQLFVYYTQQIFIYFFYKD